MTIAGGTHLTDEDGIHFVWMNVPSCAGLISAGVLIAGDNQCTMDRFADGQIG